MRLIVVAVGGLAIGCGALLGANDPIEVDGGADAAGDGGVVIGDASRAEVGACPLCAPPPNAIATCEGGTCGFQCVDGYHACGGGCAKDDDVRACGAACVACAPQGTLSGFAVCNGGKCGIVCDPDWTDCGDPNACVNLKFDCGNCGACGHNCRSFVEKCAAGACVAAGSADLPCN